MKLIKLSFTLIGLSIIGFFSCGEDAAEDNIRVFPEFRPFIDKFVRDGEERGVTIDFEESGLSILLGPITNAENAAGVCNGNGTIEIANNVWDRLSDNGKEFLIYHELGHCILDYPHRNSSLENEEWNSIMRGGNDLIGMSRTVNYSGSRKRYYIDELFDPTVAAPEWVSIQREYQQDIVSETIFFVDSADSIDVNKFVNGARDFQIEFTLTNPGLARAGLRWGGTEFNNSIFILWNHLNEMELLTGPDSEGLLYSSVGLSSLVAETNKITIRKIDELYYFFVNEDFIYWTDYVPLLGSEFETVGATSTNILNSYPHSVQDFSLTYLD